MAKSKKKITRKQLLKEPDEFQSISQRMLAYATQYKTQILLAAGGFFILLAVFAGYRYYVYRVENNAFGLLQKATATYETTIQKSDAVAANQAVQADFERILKRYAGRNAAKMAGFMYAGICYRAGRTDAAIDLYTTALKDFSENTSIRGLALSGLGYCYEAKHAEDKAVGYFEEVADGPGFLLKDEALFNLGRLYDGMGKKEQSLAAYRKIADMYPNSVYLELARERTGPGAPKAAS